MGSVIHMRYSYDVDQKPRPIRFGAEYDEAWRSPHEYPDRGTPVRQTGQTSAGSYVMTTLALTGAWLLLGWLAVRALQ